MSKQWTLGPYAFAIWNIFPFGQSIWNGPRPEKDCGRDATGGGRRTFVDLTSNHAKRWKQLGIDRILSGIRSGGYYFFFSQVSRRSEFNKKIK